MSRSDINPLPQAARKRRRNIAEGCLGNQSCIRGGGGPYKLPKNGGGGGGETLTYYTVDREKV